MWYMHARLRVLAHIEPRAEFQESSPSLLHYCLKTGSPTELKVWHWLASELLRSACLRLSSAGVTAICIYALF